LAVIRLAGPLAARFLKAHFTKTVTPGRCVHGTLTDQNGTTIDDPVVVHVAPDTFDVNLHGGPWVVRATLDLARQFGFEVVESLPAPLPEFAVDGAHALERDVLRYLPQARTELAVRALLAQRVARKTRAPDPADRSLYWLLKLPRVAIVGPANVGKSTLANQLFATERSITADVPGTTRDWVGEIANLDGLAVMLIDTPGIRATHDPIEAEAIARAEKPIAQADLIVVVLDVTRPLEGEQADLVHRFPGAIVALNKSDRLKSFDLQGIPTVATTGDGIDALRQAVLAFFGIVEPYDVNVPRSWTSHFEPQINADERKSTQTIL